MGDEDEVVTTAACVYPGELSMSVQRWNDANVRRRHIRVDLHIGEALLERGGIQDAYMIHRMGTVGDPDRGVASKLRDLADLVDFITTASEQMRLPTTPPVENILYDPARGVDHTGLMVSDQARPDLDAVSAIAAEVARQFREVSNSAGVSIAGMRRLGDLLRAWSMSEEKVASALTLAAEDEPVLPRRRALDLG